MEQKLGIVAIAAMIFFLGLLSYSAFLWSFSDRKFNGRLGKTKNVLSPWSIEWTDFGLFICILLAAVSLTQFFVVELIGFFTEPIIDEGSNEATSAAYNPWITVLSLLTLQVPMIIVFYGVRVIHSKTFGGSLNQKAIPIRKAIAQTTTYFILYSPIVWLAHLTWLGLLIGLQKLGISGGFPPQQLVSIFSDGSDPLVLCSIFICAVFLAPFVEEIIFRGCIYRFFKGKISIKKAQIISGSLFALMHLNLMSFVPLLVIGILLARIYEKQGNILMPILFHAYWNSFNLIMLLLTHHLNL